MTGKENTILTKMRYALEYFDKDEAHAVVEYKKLYNLGRQLSKSDDRRIAKFGVYVAKITSIIITDEKKHRRLLKRLWRKNI